LGLLLSTLGIEIFNYLISVTVWLWYSYAGSGVVLSVWLTVFQYLCSIILNLFVGSGYRCTSKPSYL